MIVTIDGGALERTAGSHPLAAAAHRRRYPYQGCRLLPATEKRKIQQ